MQTSLSSRLRSYRLSRFSSFRGFTLIELLISSAIITVISGLVLVRFTSFDGTVILRSVAYDVATALREAQIYSVSIVNTGSGSGSSGANFRYPYGVSFTRGATSYTFYRYIDSSTSAVPKYDGTADVLRTTSLGGAMEIFDVCLTISGGDRCGLTRVDVSFRRPEFNAIFYSPPPGINATDLSNTSGAKIKLRSVRDTGSVWIVEIKLLGQITLYKSTE